MAVSTIVKYVVVVVVVTDDEDDVVVISLQRQWGLYLGSDVGW